MAKLLYHNITQRKFNETCLIDFLDNYGEGDELYYSEYGNACIEPISEKRLKDMKLEYDEYYKDEEERQERNNKEWNKHIRNGLGNITYKIIEGGFNG